MAAIWPASRVPFIDQNGDPRVGAKLRFYEANTSTPLSVYSDAGLSAPRSQPILADASGSFPPIFFDTSAAGYRQKMTDADDALLFDDPEIPLPQPADYTPPSAGETATELLFQTGDYKLRHGTGSHTGWVRANGRTIGSASSGASERANADCEDLFLFLWTADANLEVSGGRGATASADWAANRTIALPDWRGRVPAGLDDMGNSAAGRITDLTTLGEAVGSQTHTLTSTELAAHTHTGTTASSGSHGHPTRVSTSQDGDSDRLGGLMLRNGEMANYPAHDSATPAEPPGDQIGMDGAHTHTITTDSAGGGAAHNNLQPTIAVTVYLKL